MSVTSIESGDGTGFAARVSSNGLLRTEVANTPSVSVAGTAAVAPPQSGITATLTTINSGSNHTIVALSGRRQLLIQNLDSANFLHLRLAAADATTSDLRIGPGEKWSLPCFASYEGEARLLAQGGNVQTVIYQFS